MSYEVRCACGQARVVSAADAGASFRCACGKTVDVPALHVLRALKGEPVGSPLWEIQAGFMSGALPGAPVCACCRRETGRQVSVAIQCERGAAAAGVASQVASGCFMTALMFVTGIFVFSRDLVDSPSGATGLRVTVPVFVCESCDRAVTTVPAIQDALRVTPAYAGLLRRYPDATVARVP